MRRKVLISMKKLLLALPLLFSLSAFSQDSDLGNWLIYIGSNKLGDRLNLHTEVQYRNYNFIGDLEQLLIRTGVGYNLSPGNNNILLGYGYILSKNYIDGSDDKVSVNEHRIFQQFVTKQKFGRVALQHRYRFEQRFVEDDFRLRLRYFLAATVAINNPVMEDKTLYLSSYNEIFLNTTSPVFDRNRLYGGLGWRFSPRLRAEFGYMVQFFEQDSRDQLNFFVYVNW